MSAEATAGVLLAAAAAGTLILALARGGGPVDVPGYAAYLRGWRELHAFEAGRMGGFLDRWLRLPYALARPLARRGADPDLVTLGALLVAAAGVPAYAAGGRWVMLGGAAALASGLLDEVDGAVAVLAGRATAFGAVWDSTADRLADLALLLGPALWLADDRGLVAAGAALFLLEYVRARCQAAGWLDRQRVTPGERPTRVVLSGAAGLLGGAFAEPVVWQVTGWVVAALAALGAAALLRDARTRS